jgi:predicted ATPase/DNA-binding SARP family transcriptional activator
MSGLTITLLGVPEVKLDGELINGFHSSKARALLYLIAATEQPQARTILAGLLWGDLPEFNANANLRKVLTNLRYLVGPYLKITRESVALNEANLPQVDVRVFETVCQSDNPADWQTAVNLYRGDFLEGFYLESEPVFEEWLFGERRRLREQLLLDLRKLVKYFWGRHQYTHAIRHTRHLLALEPLREESHRWLMTLLAQSGQRTLALAQYEACVQLLNEALDTEPDRETTTLLAHIRDGTVGPVMVKKEGAPRHNLPAALTSFIGREAELTFIRTWLEEPDHRLLSIVGPGGVGKTRLALQAGWEAASDFVHGVWYVSLTSLVTVSELPTTIAAALGIAFFGKNSPETQVVNYLRRKELLLIFDNAEHLVSQPLADFLVAILSQAAAVKIIVTSRERLLMQAEQVLELSGLAYPQNGASITGASYPAGQLFWQRSQSHGASFESEPEVETAVYQLCRLVDGLPLALELAAAWTTTMPLPDINAEIERGIAFLTTNMRDLPARHRSMQAVFDASWQMLMEAERKVMYQLAYFQGGFSAEAAADIVGATSKQLKALVNKSLIRDLGNGRYDMHQLIRQFAAEKLKQHPAEAEQVARRHGSYYTQFLADNEKKIQSVDYLQAKADIHLEEDNVRLAWNQALAARNLKNIARSAETLHYYFLNTQGLFAEAARRFHTAAETIFREEKPEAAQLAGDLWLKAAINRRMLGQLAEARQLAEQSLEVFYRWEIPLGIARATSNLGVIRWQQNDRQAGLQLTETAVNIMRELDDPLNLCLCLTNHAFALAYQDRYDEAIIILEESRALAQEIDYPHGVLSAMNMLGVYYEYLNENEKAREILEALVEICRQAATTSRLAQALNNLGFLYKKQDEPDKAQPLLVEAVNLYEEVGQVHYATFVKVMLGEIYLEQTMMEKAEAYCRQALKTAQEIDILALVLAALGLFGRILQVKGKYASLAASVFIFISNHPAALPETKDSALPALRKLENKMPAEEIEEAKRKGAAWTLEEAVGIGTEYFMKNQ